MSETSFYRKLIAVNALIPLLLLGWDAMWGDLGANPIEFFLRTTGLLALIFLIITLLVTPLRKMFGWNQLIKFRRMLGLFAFFYAFVHLVTYSVFDKEVEPVAIVADVWQRPFIAVGMAAFALLVPLAITSTNGWVKRLGGKNWARLHRTTYVAAILAIIHFFWIQKSDYTYPIIFALVLAVLFAYRLYKSKIVAGKLSGTA